VVVLPSDGPSAACNRSAPCFIETHDNRVQDACKAKTL
jgi:hypothetical protein